jgi:imidazoleglycerol phosphate synthase glutamine amidotransferase subunit HisH
MNTLYISNLSCLRLYACNRLLLPGGGAALNATDGYATAGWELFKLAKQKNDDGIHFPVWGISLGFQLLASLSANNTEVRNTCAVERIAMPLTLKPGKPIHVQ